MDSAVFMKLAKECELVSKHCGLADIDLVFSKVPPPPHSAHCHRV
jgi:hypothetical protein